MEKNPMTTAMEAIFKRRSIRKYTNQPVTKEQLEQILQAAMAAPSGMNGMPWEFVAINDPAQMEKLHQTTQFSNYNAPAAIIVCGNPSLSTEAASERFWVEDCSLAAGNILIAATELGLGTVWVGMYPNETRYQSLSAMFGIPVKSIPVCLIYLGYADESKPSRTQYDEKRVHWQKY
jgi:nitroreductase